MVIVMVLSAALIAALAVAVLALLLIGQWDQVLVVGLVTIHTVVEVNLVVDMGIMQVVNSVIGEMALLATLVDLVLIVEALEGDTAVG